MQVVAVNMDMVRPRIKEMPKPLTGPVPNWKRKSAATTAVTLPSKMAENALSYPWSMASRAP